MQPTSDPTDPRDLVGDLSPAKREQIVRRYWLRGDLTPLAVANILAGQPAARAA